MGRSCSLSLGTTHFYLGLRGTALERLELAERSFGRLHRDLPGVGAYRDGWGTALLDVGTLHLNGDDPVALDANLADPKLYARAVDELRRIQSQREGAERCVSALLARWEELEPRA